MSEVRELGNGTDVVATSRRWIDLPVTVGTYSENPP